MIQFGWIEYGLVAFAFESPHNLWLHNLLNYTAICGIMFFVGSGEACIGTEKVEEGHLENCWN